jgi:hypothetical protein
MPNDKLDGHVVEVEEDDIKIFGVQTSIKEFSHAFVIRKLFYFKGYISPYLNVQILLLGHKPMKVNFQMLTYLPTRLLGFSSFKLGPKECLAFLRC